jgi:SulP family sulfate permease
MGGCAMIGQTIINLKSGGRGRLSGVTCSLAIALFIVCLSSTIEIIPMAALVGVMIKVKIITIL